MIAVRSQGLFAGVLMGVALMPAQGIAASVQVTNKTEVLMEVRMKSLDRNQFAMGTRWGGIRMPSSNSVSLNLNPGNYRIFATTPDGKQISQMVSIRDDMVNEFYISAMPRGAPGVYEGPSYGIGRAFHNFAHNNQDKLRGPATSFAGNLGITYEQVNYDNGTFGARLTQDPTPGSPAAQLQLEPGDTIFELDGLRFRQHQDVLNHTAWTAMRFINVRTNGVQSATVYISPKSGGRELDETSNQESTRSSTYVAGSLGITYEQVNYDNGTFGARLTQDPTPGSPAAQLQLEPGDTIFELDGIRFRQHQDVLNHTAWTTMRFINVRTNGVQSARVYIP